MELTLGIDSAIASARLWALMLRIRDPARLHKIWGVRVMNQARANARAKGGRRLWKQIADSVSLQSVSQRGAGARAIVRVQWKNVNVGHVFIAENTGKEIIFIDPQSNEYDVSRCFSDVKRDKTYVIRVDNLKFRDNVRKCCKERTA